MRAFEIINEKWSEKYKRSINCSNPKGFSQRAHCAGRKKNTNEGGWDSTATQSTVIRPSTVKAAMSTMEKFVSDFNSYLQGKAIPGIKLGHPTGSSAYHDVDDEDKIYGDIDLQIIVPETEETAEKTPAQIENYWLTLADEFVKEKKPSYLHDASGKGHPIVSAGKDQWVQVDLMPHREKLSKWGRFRATPERGVKGLLSGNMYSVLGELLNMSIQYNGVQLKVKDKVRQSFSKRKDVELVTVTTDIETFVKDIFDHEYKDITGNDPKDAKVDPMLAQHQGTSTDEVKISNLVNAVKGLAKSFEANDMFGKGSLSDYSGAEDFIGRFKDIYTGKAEADINNPKRDKAETPEAKARAEADREKVRSGLEKVLGMF